MKKTCDRCSEPLVLGLNEYYPCECPEKPAIDAAWSDIAAGRLLEWDSAEFPPASEVSRTTEEIIQRTMDHLAGRRRDCTREYLPDRDSAVAAHAEHVRLPRVVPRSRVLAEMNGLAVVWRDEGGEARSCHTVSEQPVIEEDEHG